MTKIYYDRKLESIERNSLEVEDVKNCSFRGFTEKGEKVFIIAITDGYNTLSKIITATIDSEGGSASIKVSSIPTNEGKIATELAKIFTKLDALEIITDSQFAQVFKEILDKAYNYSTRLTEEAVLERHKRIQEAKKNEEE